MMFSAVFAIILLAAYGEAARPPRQSPWQLYVQVSPEGRWDYPFYVSYVSSAVLLSADRALTVARPFYYYYDELKVSPSNFRVVANSSYVTSLPEKFESFLTNIKLHEQARNGNNIAILTLATPIYANGDTIQYAKLPANNDDQFVGSTGVISGYGNEGGDGFGHSYLYSYPIDVIDTERCDQLLGYDNSVGNAKICLFHYKLFTLPNKCIMDVGGPFVVEDSTGEPVVAGLSSSYTEGMRGTCFCWQCDTSYPVIYTRTSAYLDWIAANTQ